MGLFNAFAAPFTGGMSLLAPDPFKKDMVDTAGGRPLYPTLDSWLKKGQDDQYSLAPNLTTATPAGQQSPWEKLMLQNQGVNEVAARDQLNRQSAGNLAQGTANLAGSGGVSRGSAERLTRNSMLDKLMGGQAQENQFQGQRIGIGTQAEQNRLGQQQFDIGNILSQKRLEDAAKIGKYQEDMRAYGANKTADATANSGKK